MYFMNREHQENFENFVDEIGYGFCEELQYLLSIPEYYKYSNDCNGDKGKWLGNIAEARIWGRFDDVLVELAFLFREYDSAENKILYDGHFWLESVLQNGNEEEIKMFYQYMSIRLENLSMFREITENPFGSFKSVSIKHFLNEKHEKNYKKIQKYDCITQNGLKYLLSIPFFFKFLKFWDGDAEKTIEVINLTCYETGELNSFQKCIFFLLNQYEEFSVLGEFETNFGLVDHLLSETFKKKHNRVFKQFYKLYKDDIVNETLEEKTCKFIEECDELPF